MCARVCRSVTYGGCACVSVGAFVCACVCDCVVYVSVREQLQWKQEFVNFQRVVTVGNTMIAIVKSVTV